MHKIEIRGKGVNNFPHLASPVTRSFSHYSKIWYADCIVLPFRKLPRWNIKSAHSIDRVRLKGFILCTFEEKCYFWEQLPPGPWAVQDSSDVIRPQESFCRSPTLLCTATSCASFLPASRNRPGTWGLIHNPSNMCVLVCNCWQPEK